MITVQAFFSGTLNTVDAVIGHFVNTAYTHFIQANSEVITLLFTFYVMLLGYQFLNHSHHFNLNTVIKQLVVMLCVYGIVMNWNFYHLFVYKIFTIEPGNIAEILVNAADHPSYGTITEALDGIYLSVVNATMGFFGQVNFSSAGVAFLFYALLVFVIGSLMCVFALLLFVYAKMMMAISLALGPLFILFILWEPTKGLFAAWLRKLITLGLIPIVTSATLMLMLSVIQVTLPAVNQPVEELQFYGIAPFLGLSLATTLILSQVFRICSALGGGITLANLSEGVAIVTSSLQKSGITSVGHAVTNRFQPQSRLVKRPQRSKQ